MFCGIPDVGTCRPKVASLYTDPVVGGSTKVASTMKMLKKTVEGSDHHVRIPYVY